jgi:catechol 2,3-dioxygenase-like lactoylglutathione lyase family enzyme
MTQHLANIALVVADYDEAIAWYTQVLGFTLLQDIDMGDGKRWVRVAPPGSNGGTALLLAQANTEAQRTRIGDQVGGRVGFFLHTEDFARDHAAMSERGVRFAEEPRHEPYGSWPCSSTYMATVGTWSS